MLKSIPTIIFIFLFSFTIFGQDFHIPKGSRLVNLHSGFPVSNNIKSNLKANDINTLYHVLPNTDAASYSARGPIGTYNYERGIYLITPDEMSAAGIPGGININQIAWTYYIPGNASVTGNLKVYLENTSNTTNTKSTTWIDAIRTMTFVDDNTSFTIPASDNVIETLSSPASFTYTGGGLYIAFDYYSTNTNTGTAIFINTNLANGNLMAQSNTSSPLTVAPVSSRPETYLGFSIANDAQVVQVYTMGKIPVPYGTPQKIITAIKNNGYNDLYNLNITLNITGANLFYDVKSIDTLPSGGYKLVTFSLWTPATTGIDSIMVSVPPDEINSNNSVNVIQLTTLNNYSYVYGPFPSTVDGGIGFDGQTGDFIEKFSANLSAYKKQVNGKNFDGGSERAGFVAYISQVKVNFTVSGQPFKIGIWDATGSGGTPGQLIWQSASLTSTQGISTILVNPKVGVNGDFYVGVRQTGTTNLAVAYQSEDPVRANTFYSASPTGSSSWVDFAVSGNPFRFMIEPGLTLANDVGVSSIDFPLGGTSNNLTSNIAPKATVSNFGSNNQTTPFSVTMDIFNFDDIRIYSSTKTLTLNSGSAQQVTFDASFNPASQSYTANCYTSLGTDGNNTNNLVTASFNYVQFSLNLTALFEAMYVYGIDNGSNEMPMAPSVTIELHNASTPYTMVETKTTTLSAAGVCRINNFTSSLNNISSYYIVVKSPNTLETWSATAQSFSSGILSYNFTTGVDQAFTDGSLPPLALHSGKYCLYSGDCNQDGFITSADFTGIDNDGSTGDYHVENDVDGNGFVTSGDFTYIDNNGSVGVHVQVPPTPGAMVKQVIKSHIQRKSSGK